MLVITLSEVFSLVLLGLVLLFIAGSAIKEYITQSRCKHEDVRENMACHAICRECGKDLGFIGTWREKQKEKADVKSDDSV